MAAPSASIASFVLLLLLVVAVPSSSNHVKLDLHGSVYPDGEFFATMGIGAPAREYYFHVDTGSDLTWLQCRVPQLVYCQKECKTWRQPHQLYNMIPEKLVPSTDRLCQELLRRPGNPNDQKCSYELHYPEESSQGYLVHDKFSLSSNAHHTFVFGCGYNQVGGHTGPSRTDGVLALGRGGSVTLTSQLKQKSVITKNVISHCFRARGGGSLFIGEYEHYSVDITRVDYDQNTGNGHYSPAVQAALHFGGYPISNNMMKVVFDSGSTYTYFEREPYQMTVHAVKSSLHASLRETRDPAMGLCWQGRYKFRSIYEAKPLFKTLALVFTQQGNHASTFEIPPENYLIVTRHGNVCFAILPGGMNLIGAVTMQDRIMIYDNEAKSIGWAHDLCERTESESVITSRL